MSEINSCSTSLTGPSEGPREPILSDFQSEGWVLGFELPQLCALFLSTVRDHSAPRLEHVWKIPVNREETARGPGGTSLAIGC